MPIRKTCLQFRQTYLEVKLGHLSKNLAVLEARAPQAKSLVLLKADAYGLGALALAKHFSSSTERKRNRLHGFGVANVEEGLVLREAGVRLPILVLSGVQNYSKKMHKVLLEKKLTPVISSYPVFLQAMEIFKKNHTYFPQTHLKFNSGMNRLGINEDEVVPCVELLHKYRKFPLEGVMSHFASAEEGALGVSARQVESFVKTVKVFEEKKIKPRFVHLANSEGVKSQIFPQGNLVRLGVHLFGMGDPAMQPVLTWKAQIYQIRNLRKGEGVGYGLTFKAPRAMVMAVLGVGYADGYPRVLSNRGSVLVRGVRCGVIGNVSMDLTAVDVSAVPGINLKDEAILIGSSGNERISVDDLAALANTIPYEIATGISLRVPRRYVS